MLYAIEGQMTKVKRIGRRRTQLLEDLRNRSRYWELKEEAEDRKSWERGFFHMNLRNKYKFNGFSNKQHT